MRKSCFISPKGTSVLTFEKIFSSHPFLLTLLLIFTFLTYFGVWQHDFITLDDGLYVFNNPYIKKGFARETFLWALTDHSTGLFHPLTWYSLFVDRKLFGLKPMGFHLTNLLLHMGNVSLLFLFLVRFTGEWGKSFFVAALFALHPVNVESVAWVAERKNVLSTFFWFLSLLAYGSYVQRPSRARYVFSLLCFALGLMAKPMLVTMPFLLLLLDFWPLKRWERKQLWSLFREKFPFFVLSLVVSFFTVLASLRRGALMSFETLPLYARLANTLLSYGKYLLKIFLPTDLGIFYPLPQGFALGEVLPYGGILVVVTLASFQLRNRYPYFFVGWGWFLVTLIPVIGLLQVGSQAFADRYLYVPGVGIFLGVVWWGAVLWRRRNLCLKTAIIGGILLALFVLSHNQQVRWQDSESIYRHTLSVTKGNYRVHDLLGVVLERRGKAGEALFHFYRALEINPRYASAYNNRAVLYLKRGKLKEARLNLEKAIKLNPRFLTARYNLALVYLNLGEIPPAVYLLKEILREDSNYPDARELLAVVLAKD